VKESQFSLKLGFRWWSAAGNRHRISSVLHNDNTSDCWHGVFGGIGISTGNNF